MIVCHRVARHSTVKQRLVAHDITHNVQWLWVDGGRGVAWVQVL